MTSKNVEMLQETSTCQLSLGEGRKDSVLRKAVAHLFAVDPKLFGASTGTASPNWKAWRNRKKGKNKVKKNKSIDNLVKRLVSFFVPLQFSISRTSTRQSTPKSSPLLLHTHHPDFTVTPSLSSSLSVAMVIKVKQDEALEQQGGRSAHT